MALVDVLAEYSKEPEQKQNFKCRICGHTEYDEVRGSNGRLGRGFRSWRVNCYCKGCSVIFYKPEQFSVAESELQKKSE